MSDGEHLCNDLMVRNRAHDRTSASSRSGPRISGMIALAGTHMRCTTHVPEGRISKRDLAMGNVGRIADLLSSGTQVGVPKWSVPTGILGPCASLSTSSTSHSRCGCRHISDLAYGCKDEPVPRGRRCFHDFGVSHVTASSRQTRQYIWQDSATVTSGY